MKIAKGSKQKIAALDASNRKLLKTNSELTSKIARMKIVMNAAYGPVHAWPQHRDGIARDIAAELDYKCISVTGRRATEDYT